VMNVVIFVDFIPAVTEKAVNGFIDIATAHTRPEGVRVTANVLAANIGP
jgi:hypothetical protein